MAEKLVFTPGGLQPRSRIHVVPSGYAVKGGNGRSHIVSEDSVAERGQRSVAAKKSDRNQKANWIEYAYWDNVSGSAITKFKATWIVPPPPTRKANQLIYLFNGIEPPDHQAIIQPVLQWGASGFEQANDGPFWCATSWYVDPQGEFHFHPQIRVNSGEVLTGVITMVRGTGNDCDYCAEFLEHPETRLGALNVGEFTHLVLSLEAYETNTSMTPPYDLVSVDEYPATEMTSFSRIEIQRGQEHPVVSWTPQNLVTTYGEHVKVIDDSSTNGRVDFYFKSAQ
jgi:hypothetical protein